MKLLDREFLSDFFRAFLVLVLLLSIVHMVDTILSYYTQMFGETENGFYWGLVLMLCELPGILVDLAAVAVSAAILWVVTRKARQNEILAWLSGGISPARLSVPFLVASVLVGCCSLALTEWVVGVGERHAKFIDQVYFKGEDPSDFARDDQIFQKGTADRFYVIGSYDAASMRMLNPHVVEFDPETRLPAWRLEASSGYIDDPNAETFDKQGNVTSHRQWESIRDVELPYPMESRLKSFLGERHKPEYMGFLALRDYISILKAQGKEVSELTARLHAKLALPLGACIIALVVCAHVMRPRAQGVIGGLGGGLLWVIAYYAVFFGFQNVARAGVVLPPAISTWLPNVIFAVAGVVLMLRTGR
jgi:lipopolysaccharide export system permease protein